MDTTASSPPASTRISRSRPRCPRSRPRLSSRRGRHRSSTTRLRDCAPPPPPRWSPPTGRSSRVSIGPANLRAGSLSTVSRAAWCSAVSPAAMPLNAPHDRASQHRSRTARMSAGAATHATVITVEDPAEVAAGAEFVLTVLVSCPAGCDLSGIPIEVMAPPDNATATVPAPCPPPHAGEGKEGGAVARRVALKAPLRAGEHVWHLSCAAHKRSGWPHDASLLRVPVRVRPHETSLAVWAIPSPVVTSRPFAIKVGAKSAAGCDLTGMPTAVRDAAGTMLAGGGFRRPPLPGPPPLYLAAATFVAPGAAWVCSWSVEFAAADLAVPHQGSSSRFSIAIVDPPEHRLTIKVVAQETASPVENAQVRLGAYRATTDGSGFAQIMVPKGAYDLNVWKSGYH